MSDQGWWRRTTHQKPTEYLLESETAQRQYPAYTCMPQPKAICWPGHSLMRMVQACNSCKPVQQAAAQLLFSCKCQTEQQCSRLLFSCRLLFRCCTKSITVQCTNRKEQNKIALLHMRAVRAMCMRMHCATTTKIHTPACKILLTTSGAGIVVHLPAWNTTAVRAYTLNRLTLAPIPWHCISYQLLPTDTNHTPAAAVRSVCSSLGTTQRVA